jgi:hypothetical protein
MPVTKTTHYETVDNIPEKLQMLDTSTLALIARLFRDRRKLRQAGGV